MKRVIKDFNIQEEEKEIKRWYDGYIIGKTDGIYNPWSILYYVRDKELMPYWVNTSSNDLIKLILRKSVKIKEQLEKLMRGEKIEVTIDLETIIKGIEDREENIWGLMVATGYLKVAEIVNIADGTYKLQIPNYEIKSLFTGIIRSWFREVKIGEALEKVMKSLITLNLEEFEKQFTRLVLEMFSFFDVGEDTAENFYHAFVLGMLVSLKDTYYVHSNRESGIGRYDIMLEPQDKNANSFIIEFKVVDTEKNQTFEEAIEQGKKQIEEKKYETELRERGCANITKMVFAFKGKDVKMEVY